MSRIVSSAISSWVILTDGRGRPGAWHIPGVPTSVSASAAPTAIEFFSGIGGFAAAARAEGVRVLAAFDQYDLANRVYREIWGLTPSSRNLATIGAAEVPRADLWWMSPPCTPFVARGRRRDADDPRAAPFLNLVARFDELRPAAILVENVPGFVGSRVHEHLLRVLDGAGYGVAEIDLDPTDFGAPMRRRRHFVAARPGAAPRLAPPPPVPLEPLARFLDPEPDPSLEVGGGVVARYGRALDVVGPDEAGAVVACTTRAYATAPLHSGSVLRLADGRFRRLSPREIVRLLGFPDSYEFPGAVERETAWALAGNSIDVRAARHLLQAVREGSPACEAPGTPA